ncbi:hypothetical protein AC1031_001467 [Aphanomyces cochlioides]|nr:hypothetical protein AC1031_001467 [Aphanomyces cochlioides]
MKEGPLLCLKSFTTVRTVSCEKRRCRFVAVAVFMESKQDTDASNDEATSSEKFPVCIKPGLLRREVTAVNLTVRWISFRIITHQPQTPRRLYVQTWKLKVEGSLCHRPPNGKVHGDDSLGEPQE